MADNNHENKVSRREALKSVGAGTVATIGFGQAVTAKSRQGAEPIEVALRIKERTGSIEKFRNYLRNRGYGVGTADIAKEVKKPASSDGVSTSEYEKYDWSAWLSIIQECDGSGPIEKYYVDLSWEFDGIFLNDIEPADVVGFAWGYEWALRDDNYRSSNHHVWRHKDKPSGIAWKYDDLAGDNNMHWVGAYLHPQGDVDEANRQVYADYIHTYQDVDYSVTITTGGVGINAEPVTDKKHWDSDHHSNRLVVSEEDAEPECGI